MEDKLKVTGVLSQGYGIIPKLLMKDSDLTIEAKAIYAYIASYAGNGSTAFPSVSLICTDLNISENRFHNHKKVLIEKGYIHIDQERSGQGTFKRNIYTINTVLAPQETQHVVSPTPQNEVTVNNSPTRQKPSTVEPTSDKPSMENKGTNNNSLNNNSFNNNSMTNNNNKKEEKPVVVVPEINLFNVYQENFGIPSSLILQEIAAWETDLGKEMVFEAMKRATLNQKPFSWAVGVMRGWAKKNIKTVEQVEADDVAFSNSIQQRKNSYRNNNIKVEPQPEWMQQEQPKEEKVLDASKQEEFAARLNKFRKGASS